MTALPITRHTCLALRAAKAGRAARFFGAVAILFGATTVWAQDGGAAAPVLGTGPGSCVLVFGHGRNFEPTQAAQNEHWDQLNLSFNREVVDALNQARHTAHALVLKVSALDLARNARLLLDEAQRLGCGQVLETTVFADVESSSFKARLRLYPLQGMKGPRTSGEGLSIGAPLYTNERGFELNQRNLERLRPELLARTMSDEFLQSFVPASRTGAGASSAAAPAAVSAPGP